MAATPDQGQGCDQGQPAVIVLVTVAESSATTLTLVSPIWPLAGTDVLGHLSHTRSGAIWREQPRGPMQSSRAAPQSTLITRLNEVASRTARSRTTSHSIAGKCWAGRVVKLTGFVRHLDCRAVVQADAALPRHRSAAWARPGQRFCPCCGDLGLGVWLLRVECPH